MEVRFVEKSKTDCLDYLTLWFLQITVVLAPSAAHARSLFAAAHTASLPLAIRASTHLASTSRNAYTSTMSSSISSNRVPQLVTGAGRSRSAWTKSRSPVGGTCLRARSTATMWGAWEKWWWRAGRVAASLTTRTLMTARHQWQPTSLVHVKARKEGLSGGR